MAKYVENFNEWALSMYREYVRISNSNTSRWKVFGYGEKDSIQIVLIDLKKGKCGKARVSKGKYIEAVGIGVAWARLRNYEIPKERKSITLKNFPNGEKFCPLFNIETVYIKIGENPSTEKIVVYNEENGLLDEFSRYITVYNAD
jgi:hypothetical protein